MSQGNSSCVKVYHNARGYQYAKVYWQNNMLSFDQFINISNSNKMSTVPHLSNMA